jgi:hypothetical protein
MSLLAIDKVYCGGAWRTRWDQDSESGVPVYIAMLLFQIEVETVSTTSEQGAYADSSRVAFYQRSSEVLNTAPLCIFKRITMYLMCYVCALDSEGVPFLSLHVFRTANGLFLYHLSTLLNFALAFVCSGLFS